MRGSHFGRCRARGRAGPRVASLRISLCLVLVASAGFVFALDPQRSIDQYAHDTWGVRDGLPEGAVLSLRPTSDGYLWIGAQNGLLRFDGARFNLFESGRLGLKPYSFARDLVEGEHGEVWAALAGGVARFADGAFSFFDDAQGLEHPFVYAIAPGPEGSLFVGTGGSGVWQLRNGSFSRHPAYSHPGLPTKVDDLAVDGRGTLWIATERGVVELGSSVRTYTAADGLGSDVANVLRVDRAGTLWVGTRAGLAHRVGGRFRNYTTRDGLSHDDVTALLEDKDGNLWIGTHDGGLDRFSGGRFDRAPVTSGASQGGVFALAEDDDGSLWVGSDRGLERYRDGTFVTFGRSAGFAYEQLLNIAARRAGGLWVLDRSGAILIHEGRRVHPFAPSGAIGGEGMLGLVETADGLFVGGGVLHRFHGGRWERYTNPGGEFTVLQPDGPGLLVAQTDAGGRSTLSRWIDGRFEPVAVGSALVHVQRLYRDRSERLWISTGGGGLVRVGPDGTRVFDSAHGLPHDVVYGLAEDEAGSLWVATRGGLARIRRDTVVSFAGTEGAPRPPTIQLQLDGAGFLWTTGDDGVYRIRASDLDAVADGRAHDVTSLRYGTADGLGGLEISWRPSAQVMERDGRLWYATSRGLATVATRSVPSARPAPPVYVEDMRVGGRSVSLGAGAVAVGAGRERIEIRFTAPSLNAADAVRFRYRLVGYDDDWVDDASRRAAHYTNVPAGLYTFRVAARQLGGDWGKSEATLHVRVLPRWHETAGARLLGAGLTGLLLVGAYRLRLRHLRRREQLLVAKVAERTEELRQEVAERGRAEEQVRALAERLEARVRERTAELERANEALASDVAERGRAEAALADEKERLSVTLRSLGEGVIATDVDGRVLLMNAVAERHTGWPSAEASGRPVSLVFRLVDRATRAPVKDPVASAVAFRAPVADPLSRVVLVGRGGDEILVEASAAPIRDRESAVVGAVLVFRDVTEKARAEEHLQRSQKLEAVGLLAAGIAHDFNNLLTVVYGYAESLVGEVEAPEARRKIDEILRAARQSADLTRQLLAFSRRQVIQPAVLDLNEVISEASVMLRRVIGDDITLRTVTAPDLGRVRADPGQIEQVVMNLVLNARDAMPDGGRLTIETANADVDDAYARQRPPMAAGRYVRLAVSDTGSGMDAATQAHVFDPFFTQKPAGKGSGLGLATLYGIVQQNEGFTSVYSELGSGTTFKVYLPRVDEPLTARTPPPPPTAEGGTEAILLVEDHEVVREILTEILSGLGYRVLAAATGEEALAISTRTPEPIALLLTDVKMPGMSGRDLARHLAESRPGMRVLYMSGYTAGAVSQQGILDEGIALVEKPIPASKLAAKIREVLDAPEAPSR